MAECKQIDATKVAVSDFSGKKSLEKGNFLTGNKQRTLVILISAITGAILTRWVSISDNALGYTQFLFIPFLIGLLSALLDFDKRSPSMKRRFLNAAISIGLAWVLAFILGAGGLIFLSMSLPLALGITMLGCFFGCQIMAKKGNKMQSIIIFCLLIATPLLIGFEPNGAKRAPLRKVASSISISAPIDGVWTSTLKSAVTSHRSTEGFMPTQSPFTQLQPQALEDEAQSKLIRFDIGADSFTLEEISPYGNIRTRDLDRFYQPRAEQYKLTETHDGSTIVECTTWYYHDMWPAPYWSFMSSVFVQRVQSNTLSSIKETSEG